MRAYRYKDGEPLYGAGATIWSNTNHIGYFKYAAGSYRFLVDCEKDGVWTEQAVIEFTVRPISNIVNTGTCGENLTWTLNSDGLLTISGNGPMDWDLSDFTMWDQDQARLGAAIREIIFEEGVTYIAGAFADNDSLLRITLPSTLTGIGNEAFFECDNLTEIVIPNGNITTYTRCMGDRLFTFHLPANVTEIGNCILDILRSDKLFQLIILFHLIQQQLRTRQWREQKRSMYSCPLLTPLGIGHLRIVRIFDMCSLMNGIA